MGSKRNSFAHGGGAVVLASLVALGVFSAPAVDAAELNRIVLRVNDRIATLHDFEARRTERVLQIQRAELDPAEKRELLSDLGESILRQMYEELLLLSRADQLGIRAAASEVDRSFRDTIDSLGIQNEAELAQALAASGLTEEALRAQIQRGMLMQEVIGREVRPRVRLEEEEMRRYYRDNLEDFEAPERWRVTDAVVLGSLATDGDAMREIVEDVESRLASGETLADAVRDYEELGKVTVIDLGWVGRGDLETTLETALVGLGAGDVSEPVEGRGGLHVLSVEEYEGVRAQSFPEVEDRIAQFLQKDRFANEMQAYLEELQTSSFVASEPPPGAESFQAELGSEVLEDEELIERATSQGAGEGDSEPEGGASESDPSGEAGAEAESEAGR